MNKKVGATRGWRFSLGGFVLAAVMLLAGCGASYMKNAAQARETGIEAFTGQPVEAIEKASRQYLETEYPVFYAGDYQLFLDQARTRFNKQDTFSLEESVLCLLAAVHLGCQGKELSEETSDFINSERFEKIVFAQENPPLVIEWMKFFSAGAVDYACDAEEGDYTSFFEGVNEDGISVIDAKYMFAANEAYRQWNQKREASEQAAVRAKVEELFKVIYEPERELFARVVSPIYIGGYGIEDVPLDEFYQEVETFSKEEIDPNEPRFTVADVAFKNMIEYVYHRERLLVTRVAVVEMRVIEGDDQDSVDSSELLLLKINGEWRVMIAP